MDLSKPSPGCAGTKHNVFVFYVFFFFFFFFFTYCPACVLFSSGIRLVNLDCRTYRVISSEERGTCWEAWLFHTSVVVAGCCVIIECLNHRMRVALVEPLEDRPHRIVGLDPLQTFLRLQHVERPPEQTILGVGRL